MILTVDDFRAFGSETSLEDEAIQLLLDAAEAEIIRAAGANAEAVEVVDGGYRYITLARQADAIVSVVESTGWSSSEITLDPTDYLFRQGGYVLERLRSGPNARSAWQRRVTITSTPVDDFAIRAGVQRDLVNQMLSYQPGVTAETVGSWTQQLAGNSAWNADRERESILSRLTARGRMLVVGG